MKSIKWMILAALTAAVTAGCTREEPADKEAKAEERKVAERINDPEYVGALKASAAARDQLMGTRIKVTDEMKARFAAKRSEMPEADDAAVIAALEADPEWKSLEQRSIDLNQAIEDEQRRAREIIRQRISK